VNTSLRTPPLLIALLLLIPASHPAFALAHSDQAALLDGVTKIDTPCCIGPLAVFGDRASPIVLGKAHDLREPVVAATTLGKGRAVAFGHPGYFGTDALGAPDGGRLVINALRWAAAGPADAVLRVGIREYPDLPPFLRDHDIQAEPLDGEDWLDRISSLDVLCSPLSDLSPHDIAALAEHVNGGVGLLVAEKAGDWLENNPGSDLADYGPNLLLGKAGIFWADGDLGRPADDTYFATSDSAQLCHADTAVQVLAAHADGTAERSPEDVAQATQTLMRAIAALYPADITALPGLDRLLLTPDRDFSNMKERPVAANQPFSRIVLARQLEELKQASPQQIAPHPAARAFPGYVPPNAPRVSRTLTVDTAIPGWHSTGLYAAPGEIVETEVSPRLDGKDLHLRIGAHSDTLWHHSKWRRVPEITRTFPLASLFTAAASPFGGLIYIQVPDSCDLGIISLTIHNAVEAPYYARGKTDLRDWRATIRYRPAPWAEIQGNNLILTLPASVVRDLDDPEAVMKFWDDVLDADADLATIPRQRSRPERICADVQISAGYMHSGYPIMTHLDAADMMVNARKIMADRRGGAGWGFFHELGHNHQSPDWTFSGTGEVTVNLFTLYVCETVCGTPAHQTREQLTPRWMLEQTRKHLADGADFEKWKASPFLGLIMYVQLKDAFGWEAYKTVFAEYRNLPDDERPKNDDEKRDQWLVRFSRAVGKNLGPFFQAWGIPTSDQARDSISDLPIWMPEGFPPA